MDAKCPHLILKSFEIKDMINEAPVSIIDPAFKVLISCFHIRCKSISNAMRFKDYNLSIFS